MTSSRFPNYQPSTTLRQAIDALKSVRKRRAEAEASEPGAIGGDPRRDAQGTTPPEPTPRREGTDTEAAEEDSRSQGGEPGMVDIDALTSGRDNAE